jgi:hypothetical protein
MKLAELERHLRHHGCVLYREGRAYSIWFNPALQKIDSVPRHRERRDSSSHLQTTGNSAAVNGQLGGQLDQRYFPLEIRFFLGMEG